MKRLGVIILNYRRAPLTIGCLGALEPEIAGHSDRAAVLIDNGSDDDSREVLQSAIRANGWRSWVKFLLSPINRGFAGGNNLGFRSIDAENYLFLNSDARVQAGSLSHLLEVLELRPEVGAVGPRLQGPDGQPQVSCFRDRTPITEMLDAAGTGLLDRLFARHLVPMVVFDQPMEAQWVSYACIMIRRTVIERVGPMDEGYFMYFEDIDYSRRIRQAGWRILHDPHARVVHLRGGTSSVKAAIKARKRVPQYYYESRSRYFAKFYGGEIGLWLANLMWMFGRSVSFAREIIGDKERDVCECAGRDNWTNWLHPICPPTPPTGGEL